MNALKKIVSKFKGRNILVIGDLILDQYIRGSVSRISPEAPVPIVLQEEEPIFTPGGASNVAKNLQSLGAKVTIIGKVGKDAEGKVLLGGLKKQGISTSEIFVDPLSPTILKTRIIARHQQVLRIDREKIQESLSESLLKKVLRFAEVHMRSFDAVILSDYGKGMVTPQIIEGVCGLAKALGKIVTVDPKVGHFAYYRSVTAITPNKSEAENAIRNIKVTQSDGGKLLVDTDRLRDMHDVKQAGEQLLKFLDLESVLITLGEEGMCLFVKDQKPVHIPTKAQDVFDVTGAGDTVIAVYTIGLSAGATKLQAAELANYAAGIVVGKMGAVAVSAQELIASLKG